MTITFNTREMRDYRRLRAESGYGAREAFVTVRNAREVTQSVAELNADETYDSRGSRVSTFVRDGWTFRVTFEHDPWMTRPEDEGECYSVEDVEAFNADRWHYYSVVVQASNGAAEGIDGLGMVEAGDYFERNGLLDTEGQLWQVVFENGMCDNALEHAIASFTSTLTGARA